MSVTKKTHDPDQTSELPGVEQAPDVIDGDPRLAALFQDCYPKLMRHLASRCAMGSEAPDLAQQTWAQMMDILKRHPIPIRDWNRYMFATANNLTRDRWQEQRRERQAASELMVIEAEEHPATETLVANEQQYAAIKQAIHELPKKHRDAVITFGSDLLSHAECAQQLGVSKRTFQRHISDAIDEIRQKLGFEGGDK